MDANCYKVKKVWIRPEEKEYLVEVIKREDNVTYTGKLAELFGRNLLCAIEDVDIERIGDKAITEIVKTTSDADSATVDSVDNEVIKEPEVNMSESMAPEIIQKEDIEIIETPDGFINISFNELDEIFGKENKMTESQKDTLWEEYNNKNVRWTGEEWMCFFNWLRIRSSETALLFSFLKRLSGSHFVICIFLRSTRFEKFFRYGV